MLSRSSRDPRAGRRSGVLDPVLSAQAGVGVVRRDRVNAERLAAYHRLDVRFDHRRHFRRVTLVSFFSVLNAYNRRNVFRRYWDAEAERPRPLRQWGLLPVGGLELEF